MNHDTYDNAYIAGILNSVKTIAMIGASPNDVRPSYFVLKYLLAKGFSVFPINPGHAGKEILGRTVYASLADLPQPVDMIDIFRASSAVPGIVDQVLKLDPLPKVVWMQLGVRHDEAARPRRGGRHQDGDEPLPEDRIRQAVRRDRLDRRQLRRSVVEETLDAPGVSELRRAPEVGT